MPAQPLLADSGVAPLQAPRSPAPAAQPRLREAPRATWLLVGAARAAGAGRGRRLGVPLAASVLIHAMVLATAWWLVSGSAERGTPFSVPPLQATLSAPVRTFAVPPVLPTPAQGTRDVALPGETPAVIPVPLPPPPRPRVTGSPQGRASIAALEADVPAEPWLARLAAEVYPGAPRVTASFEVEPASIYPRAAAAQRRQANFTVAVVMHEDGRVELIPRTFEDPVFASAVAASLAQARAQLPEGTPRAWALLTYMFEFVGEDAGAQPR
jgi:hypothetical protein